MLPTETAKAVVRLFAKYTNPKMPTDEGMSEWRAMAQDFAPEVWDEAATRHWRTGSFRPLGQHRTGRR